MLTAFLLFILRLQIREFFSAYRVLFVVKIYLALASKDEVVLAKSIVWLRSCEDWNKVVLFTELNQLWSVVLVNCTNLIDEQCNSILFAADRKTVDDRHYNYQTNHSICTI